MSTHTIKNLYTTAGSRYLQNNPTWHVEDSPYKVRHILSVMKNLPSDFRVCTVAEVGCGAGEILNLLHANLCQTPVCEPIPLHSSYPSPILPPFFKGFDIAPDAIELCRQKEKEGLAFHCGDFFETNETFDIILLIDVFEHLEDYYAFLRRIRVRANYFIFNIPLEMNVLAALANSPMFTHEKYGHKHFFSKDIALAALETCGYHIIAHEYGLGVGKPAKRLIGRIGIGKLARRIIYSLLNKDFAVRLIGGSLFVLASTVEQPSTKNVATIKPPDQ